ncbi:MBL fold metallo-hydrolase [Haloferax sp. MBLA0076]|uniref:MBL fold metallo-hydrolase n=1 Tax=Haloferax litoreum TaxID=2666140 RepID=A0A6A8GIX8_9EURY|nr:MULTISPECIES: MBL fold metallo-hydrolase [Haloferax]KAB1194163.1 MBL fold metallo-hydrolase [Haloferax sp. CBA1148]MRX22721.1 MBL fold metallo-hydrolase [Haloferax litoreum]
MTRSDWSDWLPRAVEAADPETVAIWYLGCNGFVLKGSEGTTVFIDPYVGVGSPPRTIRMVPIPFDPEDVTEADAVLATHEHTDHVHGPSQAPILENTGATFVAPDDSLSVAYDDEAWFDDYDLTEDQFEEVTEGDTVEIGEFTVHVEPASDPDATHPVSYVFEHESGTFFHGGDTKPSEEFSSLGETYDIDLGVLAFGTVGNIADKQTGEPVRTKWYNDENQIIEAASDLDLDRLLPSHWDMWKGMTSDPKVLHHHAKSFAAPRSLELVEIGDRVDL